ncbi:hypothetical protein ACFQV4_19950 [Streptomyces thermocarboxydus]
MTVQDPQLFTDAFRAALTDAEFAALLKERDFSLQFVLTGDAGTAFLLDSDGVHDGAPRPRACGWRCGPRRCTSSCWAGSA